MKQSRIFAETEGFNHFERNGSKPNKVIIETIIKLNLNFERCLEIGCADGATLAVIKDYYPNTDFVGIEASGKVLENAILKEGISYLQSTAECMPNFDKKFDCLICGGFFYVLDFEFYDVVSELINNNLKVGGYLIIWDYFFPFRVKRNFKHDSRITVRKDLWDKMFSLDQYFNIYTKIYHPDTDMFSTNLDDNLGLKVFYKYNP